MKDSNDTEFYTNMLQQVLNKTIAMLTLTKKQTHVYKTGNPKMAREENSIGLHLYTFALFYNFLLKIFSLLCIKLCKTVFSELT